MAQARTYNLQKEKAIAGGKTGGGNFIKESGGYVGKILHAKEVVAKTGSVGIEIAFENDEGQHANFLALYTHNVKGEELWGLDKVNALMTCCKVKTLTPVAGTIEEFDFTTSSEIKKSVTLYSELSNARVGLIIQKEHYLKVNGEQAEKGSDYSAFNAESKQTADEIMEGKTAERLDKTLATLTDKDSRKKGGAKGKPASGGEDSSMDYGPETDGSMPDFDDDIPF